MLKYDEKPFGDHFAKCPPIDLAWHPTQFFLRFDHPHPRQCARLCDLFVLYFILSLGGQKRAQAQRKTDFI